MKKSLNNVVESFISLRVALDSVVIGYSEVKDALCCALLRRALGLKGHVLVFSAPGLAKTTLVKGTAKLLAAMNGGHTAYGRTQGRSDLTPEEFLSRRISTYDESGRLCFSNALQTAQEFLTQNVIGLPGLWHFDEIDKVPGRAQFGLLQVMEEQAVTVEGLGTQDLNFMLFATANTKKYDPAAQPIPTSVKDRFTSVVELGFLPLEDDVEVLKLVGSGVQSPTQNVTKLAFDDLAELRSIVAESGLGTLISISDEIIRGVVTVTKLTQSSVNGFTDFFGKFKVAAGPRSYIDFLQEAAVLSLLKGDDKVSAATCVEVGCRVYRGRVEVTPDVTMNGDTADTILQKILHEVFGGMRGTPVNP